MAMSDNTNRQARGVGRQAEPPGPAPSQFTPHASRLTPDGALIIFARAPVPGQVKTRLCPPLTPDEAASLHGSLVLDVLERTRPPGHSCAQPARAGVDRFVACSPSAEHVFFKILAQREGVGLLTQAGEDLGTRMRHACETVFAMGYQKAVLVGSDLPAIPGSVYADAFLRLEGHDLVLGPARDGGYYLIGLRPPVPDLFTGVPWSTERVFDVTMKLAQNLGLNTAVLPLGSDLDTIDDLTALIDEVGLWAGKRSKHPKHETGPLSARTAGVLRLLASRLQSRAGRPAGGPHAS